MVHALRTGMLRIRWNLPTWILVLAAIVGTVAACENKSPTAPPPPPTTNNPPPAPSVVELKIVAPPTIAPGESAQLTANARKSDGTVEDVAGQTVWTPRTRRARREPSNTPQKAGGDVSIFGRAVGFAARCDAVAEGHVPLTGRVAEAESAWKVTVTVVSGVGKASSVTNQREMRDLRCRRLGRLRAAKDSYTDQFETIDVAASRSSFRRRPEPAEGPPAGTYALSIGAVRAVRRRRAPPESEPQIHRQGRAGGGVSRPR